MRPSCSTCTRVGRSCVYDDEAPPQSLIGQQFPRSGTTLLGPHALQTPSSAPVFPSPLTAFDPFQHSALRGPIVNAAVAAEALKHLGTFSNVSAISTAYFNSIYRRLPIISLQRFQTRLPSLCSSSPADYTAMCLCMHLVQQTPVVGVDSMQSQLYVMVKSIISLMEATGYTTLDALQCRIIVAFYEMGHGIYPAAAISIGGCARLAIAIGLNKSLELEVLSDEQRLEGEERRRTWWAIVNLDRYINLSTGNPLFATLDFAPYSPIPIDDDLWAQNIIPSGPPETLSTPSSTIIGVFARECQVSHLVGRVIRHVFDPTLDATFQEEEAVLLERTLLAFLPLLLEDGIMFGKYCVALGICSSALFTLHNSHLKRLPTTNQNTTVRDEIIAKLDDISTQIAGFTKRLFGDVSTIDFSQISPYIPYCVYQSAVVQGGLWREGRGDVYKEREAWLKVVLGYFGRRWKSTERYLTALEGEEPELVFLQNDALLV